MIRRITAFVACLALAQFLGAQTVPSTQPASPSAVQVALANYVSANAGQVNSLATQVQSLQQQISSAATQPATAREQHFGVNLEGLSYYNRFPLFADAMLQAQAFPSGGTDANGNPTVDSKVMVFSGATPNYAGVYRFTCNGQPTLSLVASPGTISGQSYDSTANVTTATIALTPAQIQGFAQFGAPQLQIQIGNVAVGHVSNIQLIRPGCVAGQRFNPAALKLLTPFDTVRFMDALAMNGNTQVNWTDRPTPSQHNYTSGGMCYEDALWICKLSGKTPWLCVPCQANADYLTNLLGLIQQSTTGPVYVEWSNEIWNSAFPQWKQAMAVATIDPSLAYDGTGDPNILLYRWMGKQAAEVGKAAKATYGVPDIRLCPIRPILAGQWGNPDVLKYALAYIQHAYGPPNQYIYGIAIAPYATLSGPMWNRIHTGDPTVTEQQIAADYAASGSGNSSGATPLVAAFIAQAKQYSLHTRAYEFGFDSGQDQQDVAQKIAAAHDPAMGPVLSGYVNNWWAAGCEGLNWFTLTAADSSNGQWGLTADTYDNTTPKYQAAVAAAMATRVTH